MSDNENIEPEAPKVIQYLSGTHEEDRDHSTCHPDSPCQDKDYAVINAVGVRAVVVNDEKWLSREDVLLLLAKTYNGYMDVHNSFHGKEDSDPEAGAAMLSTFISAQTVNLIGAQLHRLTDGDGIDTTVPDTIPTDWLDSQPGSKPAPESPIETAIRKAKEAALEAQKAKEEGK